MVGPKGIHVFKFNFQINLKATNEFIWTTENIAEFIHTPNFKAHEELQQAILMKIIFLIYSGGVIHTIFVSNIVLLSDMLMLSLF